MFAMKKKDLAEEYSIKEYERLNDNDPVFEENLCFSIIDIKTAFNAGRESVVENMPELRWSNVGAEKMSNPTLVGVYIITPLNQSFKLELNNGFVSRTINFPFKTKKEAIEAANEDYKQRIKQALGV